MEKVVILLSTYNGEKYLPQLLNSLFLQTHKAFELHVRDDGSTDSTPEILRSITDERVVVVEDSKGNLGVAGSYFSLLERATADIFFFCDQDDIWDQRKVELSVAHLKRFGDNGPALLFTDLTVVDEALAEIGSLTKRFNLPKGFDYGSLKRTTLENFAVGCTIAFNSKLVTVARLAEVKHHLAGCAMHDWWLVMVAQAFGVVLHLPVPLLLYRQHSTNASGAGVSRTPLQALRFVFSGQASWRIHNARARVSRHITAFSDSYESELSPPMRRVVDQAKMIAPETGARGLLACYLSGLRFRSWRLSLGFLMIALLPNKLRTQK